MKTVFTNGCFDLIHPGHIELLKIARSMGDRLVVGINSDRSVRAIKGDSRPIICEQDRKAVLEAISVVDEVLIFDELTPSELIQQIKPDVLVKGGDWPEDEIVGAKFVRSYGGEVHSVPIVDGHSTSQIVEKITGAEAYDTESNSEEYTESSAIVTHALKEHLDVFGQLSGSCARSIIECSKFLVESLKSGGKVLLCGNGGSAADAQHIAAELVGRYEMERTPLPAIALTTDTSALTALSNDFGYDSVFERQVDALAAEGDVLVAITTSGNSKSIIRAAMMAREKGCRVVGLTGAGGLKFAALCDGCVVIPSFRTSRIQEAHIAVGHIWSEIVETETTTA